MCGIVAATARREVSEILLEGLRRLEYRGYDSAGMALIDNERNLLLHKRQGKVAELEQAQQMEPKVGCVGIAHTRWATHGVPSAANAHPHLSGERVAVVHNGIIENHGLLREELQAAGYEFYSATDTEVVVHLLHRQLAAGDSLLQAMQATVQRLQGAYALAAVDTAHPDEVVATRAGSPLVVGVGIGENFLASDQLALRQVTDRFIYLEEGDMVQMSATSLRILDVSGAPVERDMKRLSAAAESTGLGDYEHYMLKEIYEQPRALAATVPATGAHDIADEVFGANAAAIFDQVQAIQIVACGTSYHAGMVARYWLEDLAGVPCAVEVASEFRYRKRVQHPGTLLVTVSQSGETADTLAALRDATDDEFIASLVIANVDHSSLVRESDLVFLTQAGAEIGVASTKAFTTQLVALLMTTLVLGRRHELTDAAEAAIVADLKKLPGLLDQVLGLDPAIEKMAEAFAEKQHALFLGRGTLNPVAMEGALKLKEISYIHAEAYAAGELKHGPLALVDKDMPVVTVAPRNEMLDKLKANLQEVRARGGELFVFAGSGQAVEPEEGVQVLELPPVPGILEPIVYTLPLQLLSYHVAVLKGTDVDQPRNLAKSVTVE
jgi:glucosamine--fructose-6-phosphate aminotransferase (isomerizing)